jgi:hypothetical protein
VLAVRDDELTVRDDDDASSEVAKRKAHAGEFRTLTWMGKQRSGKPAPVYRHS